MPLPTPLYQNGEAEKLMLNSKTAFSWKKEIKKNKRPDFIDSGVFAFDNSKTRNWGLPQQ